MQVPERYNVSTLVDDNLGLAAAAMWRSVARTSRSRMRSCTSACAAPATPCTPWACNASSA
jgi:hypothetical protein